MTFSLGSLRAPGTAGSDASAQSPQSASSSDSGQAPRPTPVRVKPSPASRGAWLAWAALPWVVLVLALATHDSRDPGFSTSGTGEPVRNAMGLAGAWASDLLLFGFGASAWWLVPLGLRAFAAAAWRRWHGAFGGRTVGPPVPSGAAAAPDPLPRALVLVGAIVLLTSSCALEWTRLYRFDAWLPGGAAGGVVGALLGAWSMKWLGFVGSGVCWVVGVVVGWSLAMRFSWVSAADWIGERLEAVFERRQERRDIAEDLRIGEEAVQAREVEIRGDSVTPHPPIVIAPAVVHVPKSSRVAQERQKPLFEEIADRRLPQVDLLDAVPSSRAESVSPESLEMTSRLIEKKLGDFGVQVQVVAALPGPVITRYEIQPATGVKGSQVVGLAKDLARSLSLVSIRVVETIPGKTTMALELPNARRQTILLAEILGSRAYNDAASQLTLGLGKDIVGAPVVADLARMPHCLVAGTTGSGKSVGINAMILSLLYKAEPRDVRLILIDPKMLEMSMYEGIAHLLCPVVTDMKQAANALSWCVGEMERRYKLMSKMGVRNIAGCNRRISEAAERGELLPNPFSLTPEAPEPIAHMPYIVVVIDELADLMMVVGKKIEELIARLAQKARASGIHLILATQRPSVDVITGLIKANIPTRLSFQVSSKIDSRTILDQMGAEALLGQGDMLYLTPGGGLPVRVHGAFVGDDEVHRVVGFLRAKSPPDYIEGILEGGVLDDGEAGDGSSAPGAALDGESDAMYDQAVAVVLQHRRASISLVQRHLRIGYNRAARLLEQMEKSGLVSAMSGSGNRDLLVPKRDD
jgi:S-DNA-T family DNA segregation ATPase FtsK/SpoIIIE